MKELPTLNYILNHYKNEKQILNQKFLKDAPESGYILVCFQTGLEFGTYNKTSSDIIDINAPCLDQEKYNAGAKLLELHLFDQNSEYRAVYTQCGGKNQYLECIIDDKNQSIPANNNKKQLLECQVQQKEEYHLLYGSKYEFDNKQKRILATQDGNKKFFYIPEDPKGRVLYLKVVNYIGFEDDMLVIKNYRIAGIYTSEKEELCRQNS